VPASQLVLTLVIYDYAIPALVTMLIAIFIDWPLVKWVALLPGAVPIAVSAWTVVVVEFCLAARFTAKNIVMPAHDAT
jgi:hypothetical protein